MRQALRRVGCGLGLLVWLVALTLPFFTIVLMLNHELAWQSGADGHERVYLIQERRATGIGYSSQHTQAGSSAAVVCERVTERLFLWYPQREYTEVSTCACAQIGTGGSQTPLAEACPTP